MSNPKVILWDFDGVIINSNPIRELGFREALSEFPEEKINELLEFHRNNGGLSRYVKFRYFFEDILNESVTETKVKELSSKFSMLMKSQLSDSSLLNQEVLTFIKYSYGTYIMHIVSGSDEIELRYLCRSLEIDKYFNSIHGSPTPKKEIVSGLLHENKYDYDLCVLIGDSINDYEAAIENEIKFYGYNNIDLIKYPYLKSINDLRF
jgi:phosphoglycolate phosphatase-like HAD superfamily hydrolase